MDKKLIVTYAVLAYLKETSNSSRTSIFDIYIPLIKKGLSVYSEENNLIQIMGRSFSEIQAKIFKVFGLSIPIPVLSSALKTIEIQIDDENIFKINKDHSFIIKSYVFSDIDDVISDEKKDIQNLEEDFKIFCNDSPIPFEELIAFIKAQEIDLFTKGKSNFLSVDSLLPKYLDKVIKEKGRIYQIICNIYLGSLLASYFELKLDKVSTNVKFLIDTNFFISLIDLNTEDAFSVCNQVFKLCKQMGYQFYILESTIKQIKILLNNRIQDFGNKDFIGTIKTADIFNACIRRNIGKTDLEAIKDAVDRKLKEFGIETIYEAQIKGIVQDAKKSEELKVLKEQRNNSESALNDMVAKLYVEKYRGNNITDFSDVKCWFLHNSYSPYEYSSNKRIYERWSIGANELLVLLWLASPAQSGDIKTRIIVDGGLASYITKYRSAKTPSTKVLKGIKQKMDNAVSLGLVDEKTIYNLTIRMSEGSIDQETNNELDTLEDDKFVSKLNEFKNIDIEKDDTINTLKTDLDRLKKDEEEKNVTIERQEKVISQLSKSVKELENYKYNGEKNKYVSKRMKKYKNYTIGYIVLVLVVTVLWFINYNHIIINKCAATTISFTLFFISNFIINLINHTNVREFFYRKRLRTRLEQEFESQHRHI